MPLKEALFLGFCAVLIFVSRAALRLHLRISGHAMLLTLFFLLLARGCAAHRLAATFAGLLAGLLAMAFGMGQAGLLLPLKFVLPALVIDLMALLLPGLFRSYLLCALTAALAAGTKLADTYILDRLAGMDATVALQHGGLEALSAMAFGVAGSLMVPPVIHKLKAHGYA
ncbi:MAG: hypothetical protein ABIL09_01905 [Gemmatimonadota bacterium]